MVLHKYTISKTSGSGINYFKVTPANGYCPQKALNIEVGTGLIHEYDYSSSEAAHISGGKSIYGLLGIIHIYPISYLAVIVDYNHEKSLKVNGRDVYEISKAELISISGKDKEANKPFKEGIKKLLSSGFYFSHSYDLTKRMQREKGDERYWWNQNLYEEFKTYKVSSSWAIKVIQGFVGYSTIIVNGETLELSLISRRRYAMAGARYVKRGIDDQGSVANFVESEQILRYEGYTTSFVQIRGSVPAFWEQTGITAELTLTRSLDLDDWAFKKHFDDMINEYDKVVWANLLNNKRSYEMKLIQRFEELVKIYQGNNNRYLYFNFHVEWSNNNFAVMNEKMKLGNCSNFLGFLILKNGKVLRKQNGILRTNCLDCLDRTNIWQAFYSFKAFVHQLNFFHEEGLLNEESVLEAAQNQISEGIVSIIDE